MLPLHRHAPAVVLAAKRLGDTRPKLDARLQLGGAWAVVGVRPPRASPRLKQVPSSFGSPPPAAPAHIYDLLQWVYYGYDSVSLGEDEAMMLDRFTMRRLVWVGIGFFFAGFFARGVQIAYPGTLIAQFIDIIRFLLIVVGVSTLLLYIFILLRGIVRNRETK